MPGWRAGQNEKNWRAWEKHDPVTQGSCRFQPSPACGLGLCQQQKNNTLPKWPGTMKVQPHPRPPPVANTVHPNVLSSRPSYCPRVHSSCQVPSGHQASCLVTPSWKTQHDLEVHFDKNIAFKEGKAGLGVLVECLPSILEALGCVPSPNPVW